MFNALGVAAEERSEAAIEREAFVESGTVLRFCDCFAAGRSLASLLSGYIVLGNLLQPQPTP
ncbi:hypothetical protein C7A07_12550 [Pseudomonas fragi]|nr:hypothetical protein C7A07_12550 [Pseudomonas fragi]